MAFNWQVFKTRTLTAMVFVLVMLAGLMTTTFAFFLLFSIIHWGCWWEYHKLMGQIHPEYKTITPIHKYGVIIAGWGLLIYACDDVWTLGSVPVSAIGFTLSLIFLFLMPLLEILFSKQPDLKNVWISLRGLLYISISFAMFMHIRTGNIWMMKDSTDMFEDLNISTALYTGFTVPLITIGSIWINDTMAYIVGSLIGKRPLSSVSPKKTWEGTIGGILLSVIIVSLVGNYVMHATWQHYFHIALIASIFGTLGDLLESKIKRLAGVKDSGSFMPGHGGFLDRFDSLLLAIPFVWIYAMVFMR
ncbi:MAG: phosphatidate cytidylyltransferase [Chitinophagaceae bacterium]